MRGVEGERKKGRGRGKGGKRKEKGDKRLVGKVEVCGKVRSKMGKEEREREEEEEEEEEARGELQ